MNRGGQGPLSVHVCFKIECQSPFENTEPSPHGFNLILCHEILVDRCQIIRINKQDRLISADTPLPFKGLGLS